MKKNGLKKHLIRVLAAAMLCTSFSSGAAAYLGAAASASPGAGSTAANPGSGPIASNLGAGPTAASLGVAMAAGSTAAEPTLADSIDDVTATSTNAEPAAAPIPAFPGAEGGGKYTTGGRGGEVYEVTTLADAGPGSLRDAVSGSNRTIVFKVGGTIHLESPLKITGSNLTIAGQTAPGEGITVAGYPTTFNGDNLIIRYMRFRLGDANVTEADAFGGRYRKNIIIDHCSFSWSVDEVMSVYGNENVTVQWSIVADAMHMSRHAKGRHGYGGIWGGKNTSFHHNLFAHNSSRNPAFDSTAGNSHDFRNNVVYNWGHFASYGGKGAVTNLINNYYKPGPATENVRFMNAETTGSYYIDGNIMDGYPEFTADNWAGVHKYPDYTKLDAPADFPNPLPTQTAEEAYAAVLDRAGATLPRRDAVDARIVSDVIHRTGTHINSQNEVGGYPEFEQAVSPLADDDRDGMPNEWELLHQLDPNDPEDRNFTNEEGYTNLERYLNSIVGNGSSNPTAAITSPANNAIVQAGEDVVIEAAATDSDGAIEKVEFYRDGEKIGEDDSAPYSLLWEDVPDGTHYLVVKAIDDTGTSTHSTSVAVHANTAGSIAPWASADVGAPGIPGHTQPGANPGDVTLKSAGDIGGTADAFHFAYQEVSGNAEIVARIESMTPTNEEAEAGVMFRASLGESSPFASLMVPYIRTGKRGVTLSRDTEGGKVSSIQPEEEFQLPYWIKLVRLGDQFTSLVSPDGVQWKTVGSVRVDLPETAYVGLAADASKGNNEIEKYNVSVFSNVVITPLPSDFPTAPENVAAMPGVKQTVLSWQAVPAADSYTVKSSSSPSGPFVPIAAGVTELTYTHTGLTPGMTYYYTVTAVNEHGASFDSAVVSAKPTGQADTLYFIDDDYESLEIGLAPEGYIVSPDPQDADHTVSVVQVPPDSRGNPSAKALRVYDNAPGNTSFAVHFPKQTGTVVIEADFMSPSLPGTSVLLQVKDPGETKTPISVEVRKPQLPAPEDTYTLVYKNKNGQDVKLADPPANNAWHNLKVVANAAANRMDIYVNDVLAAEQVELRDDMRTLGLGSALFARTPGTGKGTLYVDNVKVYVEPVASPKGLRAVPGNGKVQLDWHMTSGALTYTVKRSTIDGGPYETVAAGIDATTTTYTDTSVVNETMYYYVVTAVGELGESGPSNQVSVTPSASAVKPAAPAGLTGSGSSTQAELAWQPVEHAVSYTVKRSDGPGEPYVAVGSVGKPFFRDRGLTNGNVYTYVVSATSVAGEGDDSEPIIVRPAAPLQPPGEVAAAAGDASAVITWSASAEAASYQVKRSTVNGGPYTVVADGVTGGSYTDSGLANGTAYYYVVSAHNDIASSANSESVRVIPYPAGTAPAPSDIRLKAGEDWVELAWPAVQEASSYTVKRSESRDGQYTAIASGLQQPYFKDTEVTTGRTYYYSVHSVNGSGEGVGSYPQGASPASIIVVAQDGSGMFDTVQAAIDSIPEGNTARTIIYVKNGTYEEQVIVPKTKHAISLIGESKEHTVITYTGITGTGFNEGTVDVESDDFTAHHITFANGAGTQGAANAMDVLGDRAYFDNVRMLGYQDTLLTHNADKRIYVKNSYIEGAVDFIYGPSVAVFDSSVIYNVRSGGYVTAASTPEQQEFGYLFINSTITGSEGLADVYLGRPWRPFAHVVFMNSQLDSLVHRAGWHNWGRPDNEETAKYYEYNNTGVGAAPENRVRWSKQLTPEEANKYTVHRMMRGTDGWDPTMMPVLPDVAAGSEDTTAPSTTAWNAPAAPDGLNGWFVQPVTVELAAEDDQSAVVLTEYSLDEDHWQPYTGPIRLEREGELSLRYRSTDAAGNREAAQTASFRIDRSLPEIAVSVPDAVYSSADFTPTVTLFDAVSGVDHSKTAMTLDGRAVTPGAAIPLYTLPLGEHTLVVSSTDFAGNTASAVATFRTKTSLSDLQALVKRLHRQGDIRNRGIANSLLKKLERGNLRSFMNEVQAQKGKHIAAAAADILLRHAEAVGSAISS